VDWLLNTPDGHDLTDCFVIKSGGADVLIDNHHRGRIDRCHMTDQIKKPARRRPETKHPENLYRRLFEAGRDGILILDAATRKITDVNPFMEKLLGRSRDEFLGKELWEVGLFENQNVNRQVFRELQDKGYARYEELPLQSSTGKRWVVFVCNIDSEDGHQVVHCNVRDITERKQAEEALREAHHRLSFHVENTPLAVIEWDRDFRLSRWSASAERVFGWKAEEVLGKRINDWRFVFKDDVDAVKQVMSRQREGLEEHGVSRNRNYTKDGLVIDCEWYNSVLHDDSGKLQSILSLVLDVTASKQAEEERAQLLVREQAARREAEDANRSKDEFLATLSHELRTPLASILGWARLLGDEMVDESKYPTVFETIARNAKSLAQLIDDLLDVSRIITGKLRLELRPIKLAQVIEAAINGLRPAAEAKQIHFQLSLDSHTGEVSGDPGRLQQVIGNLLSNAIKFTPKGGRVAVRLEAVDSQAEITVSDTGQGMSAEFMPHVFDRFRQADGSSTRQHKGLGLGLAIVRHLVELHGGTVQAESEGEGKGATFKVRLPLLIESATGKVSLSVGERRRSQPTANELLDMSKLEGLRVLIVDNETDTRELVGTILERCGATVRAAQSVKDAMKVLEQWNPEVLIGDIGMPDEDGYALIRQVRSLPADRGGRAPAIALTAYARSEDRVQILSAGYQMHLAKPVEPTELLAAVASLAGRRSDT
jgi:PAS domain S-box-containing protein